MDKFLTSDDQDDVWELDSSSQGSENTEEPSQGLPGQIIASSEDPTGPTWALVPMYRQNQVGGKDMWQIGFDSNQDALITIYGTLVTSKGQLGTIQRSPPRRIVLNKSGKNIQDQALQEARQAYLNKYRIGYRPAGVTGSKDIPPQLANKYRPPQTINQKTGKPQRSQITEKMFQHGVICQPKLDGVRAIGWSRPIIRSDDSESENERDNIIQLLSRLNNEWMWLEKLRDELDVLFRYLPEECGLDGELYSMDLTFPRLTSAVKTVNHKHENNDRVNYYIFDIIVPQVTLEERERILRTAFARYRADGYENTRFEIIVGTRAHSHEDILHFHDQYVEMGFEGVMIRRYAGSNPSDKDLKVSYYLGGRRNNLLKYKIFIDEEGECIEVKCGRGKENELAIIRIRDMRGNEIDMRPRGTHELRRNWYQHPEICIGKEFTFRYQELSEKGVPRFPVVIAIRDYE